jgi:hypothetical protein
MEMEHGHPQLILETAPYGFEVEQIFSPRIEGHVVRCNADRILLHWRRALDGGYVVLAEGTEGGRVCNSTA